MSLNLFKNSSSLIKLVLLQLGAALIFWLVFRYFVLVNTGQIEDYFSVSATEKVIISRAILLGFSTFALELIVLFKDVREKISDIVGNFFTTTTHPSNLAIFRIIFFAILFFYHQCSTAVEYSQLPDILRFPPVGLEGLSPYLPINSILAKIACSALGICYFTGMIGLFSRTSALLAVFLALYVLGIPQFFGKVNHSHHIIWFLAILAASRCGDVLSVDSVFAAWRRADRGIVQPPQPARMYALPLRFIWLLIGVIYFFPGFRKIWASGFSWALGENFKYQLYNKWFGLDGWTAIFRIDQNPVLYKLAALGGVVFELLFIFLIFLPRLRYLAVAAGILFHQSIKAFMGISFLSLQLTYVSFINWQAIFHRIGSWLYQQDLFIVYDGNCQLCRRAIATLRMFDIFEKTIYVNALEEKKLADYGLDWLDSGALMVDMHAVIGNRSWRGFYAYRILAYRIIFLWPIIPLLYLWPVTYLGQAIYRSVANSRTCSLASPSRTETLKLESRPRLRSQAVVVVGVFLLSVNSLLGFSGITQAWPFACYPSFERIAGRHKYSLEMTAFTSNNAVIALNPHRLQKSLDFSSSKFNGLINSILNNDQGSEKRQQQLVALWQLVAEDTSDLAQVNRIQFYKAKYSVLPERRSAAPVSRELQYELRL